MSSATSTDAVPGPSEAGPRSDVPATPTSDRLQPWQFFVLAALACATAVTFLARGQGVAVVIL